MSFTDILNRYDWEDVTASIYAKTKDDVKRALNKRKRDTEDFKALVSPAAAPFLEQMAAMSKSITQKRFGKTVQMYIPLYLSNKCDNHCIYCGFNKGNKFPRTVLNEDQILKEARVIKSYGFEHVLLVTGEAPRECGLDYFKRAFELLRPYFSLISIEVQPMETDQYRQLMDMGLHSVYIYQETYNRERYGIYHPKGKKSDFKYRLETPDRLGKAGVFKTGIGFLIGLENWRTEAFFTALHLSYLEKTYWQTKYSISFPRLRPHAGSYQPSHPISDRELLQLITAYRILDEEVELSLSVRESKKFRDNAFQLGITSISAGSKTDPGGYSNPSSSLKQFEEHDERSPLEFASVVRSKGYEPVWKDWDPCLQ